MFAALLILVICAFNAWWFRRFHPILLYVSALVALGAVISSIKGDTDLSVAGIAVGAAQIGFVGLVIVMFQANGRQRRTAKQGLDYFDATSELVTWRLGSLAAKSQGGEEHLRALMERHLHHPGHRMEEPAAREMVDAVMKKRARILAEPDLDWKELLEPRFRAAEDAWEEDRRLTRALSVAAVSAFILMLPMFVLLARINAHH